jgi:hypothetical protein
MIWASRLAFAPLLASALPANAVEIERGGWGQKIVMSCDLTVIIGGVALPDHETGKKIIAYKPANLSTAPLPHRGGEFDICLAVPPAHVERLYGEIKALLPERDVPGAWGVHGSTARFQ